IIDRFGQDVLMRPVAGEEAFDVTVKVAVSPVFLTWVMNFGGDIKITSPDYVIDQQIELAEKTLEQYK
ncbi:MAG: WYL domain-containing protein, partial [Firmicutes bacterium]|nr:WYL domain-containing protein [Bacillota bacterium]